jgi:Zn-dependent protease
MGIIEKLINHDYAGFLAWIIALTIGITVHEFAHAKFADLAGDPTPRAAGRVTLNPLAHYDLIGTTLILLLGMGWGKPVPTNALLYRRPRSDAIKVSLGGIGANIVVAFLFGVPLRLGVIPGNYQELVLDIVLLNLILAFFNILPLYPLDGSHALVWLLPRDSARKVGQFYAQSGMIPLIVFVVLMNRVSMLGLLIWGPVELLLRLFTGA